jgi:hypothetical protein
MISGNTAQSEALLKRLLDQDPTLLATVPNFTIGGAIDYTIQDREDIFNNCGELSFQFGSKWDCPLEEIKALSTEYPALTLNARFEERGCEYYGTAYIQNGSCNVSMMEAVDFMEAYHFDYIEQRDKMLDMSYEKFLKSYTHDNVFDEYPFGYIDRHIVKRIKKNDLPKFINRQWYDNKAEEKYKHRMAGGSSKEPKTKK